jgi:DNA helicase HerA-like ATPase
LEQQGADLFFGETSFDVDDLLRQDENGNGYISIIRLVDIQNRPKLFSTFMLSLLAEIYASFPEQGDSSRPKLAIFIDEAHLVFKEASKTLVEQIESIVKLIRSKGVGIYFCTQDPSDVPDDVLGQLGLKVALNEKGIPTPLAATYMRAPMTRMDILTEPEVRSLVRSSDLVPVYEETIDGETAYEILMEKIEASQKEDHQEKLKEENRKARPKKKDDSLFDELSKNTLVRQVCRTVARELARGLLGALGVSAARRKRRS